MRTLATFVLMLGLALGSSANQVNKRIRFERGATSATITGNWHPDPKANESFDRYILGASKGQKVTVTFRATAPGMVYCWQKDYENGELASSSGKEGSCSFKLPANGDFFVDVNPDGDGKAFDYTLTFSIL